MGDIAEPQTHEAHEYFTNRCMYCASKDTIWELIGCNDSRVRNTTLDTMAARQRADTRTEGEKMIDFFNTHV